MNYCDQVDDMSIMGEELPSLLVQFKWDQFVYPAYRKKFYLYTFYVVAYTWQNICFDQMWHNGYPAFRGLSGGATAGLLLATVTYLWKELGQAWSQGYGYLGLWNIWDLCGYFLVLWCMGVSSLRICDEGVSFCPSAVSSIAHSLSIQTYQTNALRGIGAQHGVQGKHTPRTHDQWEWFPC